MRILFFIAAILSASSAIAKENFDYPACSASAYKQPENALKLARAALGKQPDLANARHCEALALYAKRNYEGSAASLAKLTASPHRFAQKTWATFAVQEAKAYEAGNNKLKAASAWKRHISTAITGKMKQAAVHLLNAHSEQLIAEDHLYDALDELDQSLSLDPQNPQTQLKRAELYIKMKKPALAKEALQRLLKADPSNLKAKALLTTLR